MVGKRKIWSKNTKRSENFEAHQDKRKYGSSVFTTALEKEMQRVPFRSEAKPAHPNPHQKTVRIRKF